MTLYVDFEEEYKTSRKIDISNNDFSQEFTMFICGNFYEEANIDPNYGPDDDIIALRAAYAIIPPFRNMPLYDGGLITLVLNSITIEQIDQYVWKLTIQYSTPEMGGAGAGGYNQNMQIGPNVGDYNQWTNNFVQLGFNVSAQQETKTMSKSLLAKSIAIDSGLTQLPYVVGAPAPVGYSIDGVEGYPVFTRSFSFSVTAYFPPNRLTFPYVRRLFKMATTLNNKLFFGFPIGSVLFLEANASGDVYSLVPVTFEFQMRPNFKFSQAGPEVLADPDAEQAIDFFDTYHDPWFADTPVYSGWSVVDYRYVQQEDTDAKVLFQKPTMRYIHRIYGFSDFDKLEL